MSIYDFLQRIEADSWAPALIALFLGDETTGGEQKKAETDTGKEA